MDRFYTGETADSPTVDLPEEELHHARNVLRKQVGDVVELFDGHGRSARGAIRELDRRRCRIEVEGGWHEEPEPASRLVIATALPKGDRAKFLVEKATELGVDRLVPLVTTRGVVSARDAKLGRLRAGVVAACKQCGRNRLMTIDPPLGWSDFLASGPSSLLIADPRAERRGQPPDVGEVTVAIGPEGGWTDEELAEADATGAVRIGLGRHVLRIETAVLAAAVTLASNG